MQYGLSRAVPMGIFGFLIGMFLAFILRSLQGLDPAWDPEVGIVLGGIFCSILFVWNMGAFDPAMSAHGEEGHDEEGHGEEAHALAVAHVEEVKPRVSWTERVQAAINRTMDFSGNAPIEGSFTGWLLNKIAQVRGFSQSGSDIERLVKLLLSLVFLIPLYLVLTVTRIVNAIRKIPVLGWLVSILILLVLGLILLTLNVFNYARRIGGDIFFITSITLTILVLIAIVALIPGGPGINITNDPLGAPTGNGYFAFNFFGTELVFTKLAFFAIFVIWTVVSLALAGGTIALLMAFVAREVRSVKGKAPSPEALTPPAPLRLFSRGASWLLSRLPEPPKPQR